MGRTVLYILMLVSLAMNAQTFRGGEIFHIGNTDVYWAAVKTTYFKEYVARQEEDCWCWAACVQMVLNYQGVDVDHVPRNGEEMALQCPFHVHKDN